LAVEKKKGGQPMSNDTQPEDVSEIAPNLEQVRQRFEAWRQQRKKRTRIPQDLWQAAVALSEKHSLCHLSKALRVNHTALKKQVVKFNTPEQAVSDKPCTTFFELPTPTSLLESKIEMIKSDGSVMRMHVSGATCSDLVQLSKAFWQVCS
jgi:hypothetical protein